MEVSNFIGRTEELKRLEELLTTAQAGAGRCVLVSGEAGIGKSRLISEIRVRAERLGFASLIGRCFDQDRSVPYAPLIDMLRPYFAREPVSDLLRPLGPLAVELVKLLPELASQISIQAEQVPPETELEKRRLFESLAGFFFHQARKSPLLLIVEDLHWSDQANLQFWLYLVRRLANQPVLLILSCRNADSQMSLSDLLTALDREPAAQEVHLEPLTRSEVIELLQSVLGQPQEPSAEFVDAIYHLTEGNPFFAEEICTSLISGGDVFFSSGQWRRKPLAKMELPASLQRLVQRRLDRISPAARQIIELAAVSGRSFDFEVLQAITGRSDAGLLALLKELMAAQLLVEESADQFAFRHALTREALYGPLLARERRAMHGELVRTIERIHAGTLETQVEALAYHSFEAGLWSRALDYARRAGEKALGLYAPQAAADQFTRAIQAAGQLSQAPESGLYRLRGQAYDTLGDFDRARADYEAARESAQSSGDLPGAWQAVLDLGLLWASRDYQRTGEYCQQALALARSMDDPAAVARSLNRQGNWLMNSGRPLDALENHREALALFEELDDQAGIAETLDLLAMTSNQAGDFSATIRYYQQAIPILRMLNDRKTLASSLTMLSTYTLDETQVQEAIRLARSIDWRSGEAYALTYLGSLLAYRGQAGPGLDAARRGLMLAQTIDHRLWEAWAGIILGLIHLELLSPDAAYSHLLEAKTLATEVGSRFMIDFAAGLLASAYLQLDRLQEAADLLEQHPTEQGLGSYIRTKAAVELALARRRPAQALQLLDAVELPPRTDWLGAMAYFFALFMQLRVETLAQFGRLEEAGLILQEALELYRQHNIHMGRWRLHVWSGRLQRANGDLQAAGASFRAARRLIDEWASTITDEKLRENFHRKAVEMIPPEQPRTPSQAAKQQYGGLTRRERQVAAIVARGLTNQEIADELVVSIKTVEAHVTRILTKLGFSSRAQIAAWAVDRGLAPAPQDLDSL